MSKVRSLHRSCGALDVLPRSWDPDVPPARHIALTIIIPPEGTRDKVTRWKTGFYYIAQGAGVPIALGYLDFRLKRAGVQQLFIPTGDIEADMQKIQSFYAGISGKNPRQF